jgi:hypothetical protein
MRLTILEFIEMLSLAVGTIVRSPSANHDAPDGCSAHEAWLPGAQIDPVLKLEKAFDTSRIYIIRNRRSA